MKTKKQIKLTPLLSSVVQLVMMILSILVLLITEGSSTESTNIVPIIIIIIPTFFYFFSCSAIAIFTDDCYDESLYGVFRYRIIREKILSSYSYSIQAKPLLLFFFLPWKHIDYPSFETKEEALRHVKIFKNRKEVKKIFLVEKIEICFWE